MVAEGCDGAKRYALLLATEDSDYVKKMYGGYFKVFEEAFREEGQQWDLFRVVNGEFPEFERLQDYEGFVVSGSPHDAHGDQIWVRKLCFLLQALDAMHKKVLGICFGHQVLCRALGGKIGRNEAGWDIGIRSVVLTDELPPYDYFKGFNIPPSISIIQCHQDEVWEIPVDAEAIAYSEMTKVEMFTCGDHILGIQGHPEYSMDILYNLLDRLHNNNVIEETVAEEIKAKLEGREPDREVWLKICRSFLSGR
ncbi:Gamma-glutamyl peptidase 5 [Nymphaea thermarum]|nr:Gamma-glutamyl peptidase 5 [Nymphaea thermarum]